MTDFGIKKNETPVKRNKFGVDLSQLKVEQTLPIRRIVKPADPILVKEVADRKIINDKKTGRADRFCIRCNEKIVKDERKRNNKRCVHCNETSGSSNLRQSIHFTKEEELAIVKKCQEMKCSIGAYLIQLYRNNLGLNNRN